MSSFLSLPMRLRSAHTALASSYSYFRGSALSPQCMRQQLSASSRLYASATSPSQMVTVENGPENVAILRFDDPNSKVNTLNAEFVKQFTEAMDSFEKNSAYSSLVLISKKRDNFIAGADINQLAACKTKEQLEELSRNGKVMLDRIANSTRPVVAAINGTCLGGGLEVALACHRRVATTSAVMALPEVLIGLLPGAGGTQRLPKLIGAPQAMDIMLTGKNVNAQKAQKLGLVDVVVDPFALEGSAVALAQEIAKSGKKSSPKKRDLLTKVLELPVIRNAVLFEQARKQVEKKTRGNYPAPLAIIECIKAGLNSGAAAGYETESKKFGELGMTPESKALVSLFHARTACKKNRFAAPAKPAQTVAVIGAGLMGAGIAEVSIAKGMDVILKDRSSAALSRGYNQIYQNFDKKVKRKSMTSFDQEKTMSRLHPVTVDNPESEKLMAKADLIIEAVFEDLTIKQNVLSSLEKIVPSHCVIASNTSQIPIAKIAAACARPDKVIGMHYFSPVDKMELLEIITTDKTSPETTSVAVDAGLRQGKSVIVVGDGPGFYTTRILALFMAEFSALLQEGVDPLKLDSYLKDLGFPVGPVTLIDEVGIDVGFHVAHDLTEAFGERMRGGNMGLLEDLVAAGCLGRKSGKGFFLYGDDKKKKSFIQSLVSKRSKRELNPEALRLIEKYKKAGTSVGDKQEIQYRMLTRMVNEAVLCLQEGILHSAVDGDFGAVFGLGFPPFLGGPFRWVDSFGAENVVALMHKYRDANGPQFTPCEMLVDYAKNGKKFHLS